MKCEKCNKNNATTILTKIVNGKSATINICGECAFKAGYSNIFGEFTLNHIMPDLERAVNYEVHCSRCNSTFNEILTRGKLGCSECYSVFKAELLPTIENIHGKAYHVGKRPLKYQQDNNAENALESLKKQIDMAIQSQDFEKAAIIRDEIKKLVDN